MSKGHIINAKIGYTTLGVEDHGIMTFMLGLETDGSGQGMGGYALDSWSKEHEKRVGHPDSIMMIRDIIETVGVSNWEDLKGEYVRMVREDDSWNSRIIGIGHIVEDKWFYFSDYFKKV